MPAATSAPRRAAHAARPFRHGAPAGVPAQRRRRAPRHSIVGATAGVVGELLVTAAALFALFFVWQTWWTDVQAQHEADEIVAAFHDSAPAASTAVGVLRTDDPPPVAPVGPGETIGVLVVPRWDGLTRNAMPILEGTNPSVLDKAAAGHYPMTQQVGEVGNVALAGHRRTQGNSFRYVDRLRQGDQVIVETATAWYVYEVASHEIVEPGQWQVVAPVPNQPDAVPGERLLTLTTCHSLTRGEYGNSHRWVVHARLAGWMYRTDGTPEQVLGLTSTG